MLVLRFFSNFGEYFLLMRKVFTKPQKSKVFFTKLIQEMDKIGIDSLWIVAFISVFIGAVATIQTAFNIDSPLIPLWTVGFTVRQSMILEFCPTIISLILAGKVGSSIASEIGSMRITEQIDALEIMGINPANFLILPKIVAAIIINPFLIMMSIFLSIFGGWLAAILTGLVSSPNFIDGLQITFHPFDVFYALIKTIFFAFIISSVSSYNGFNISGGALEVGKASTKAVVSSSILIIIFNLILTQLLLA